jgi:thymidylate synthase (FAD)
MNNKIELIGHYGSDLTHAQSAWCSTVRDLTPEKLNRVDNLLLMLAHDGHHTPFEKSSLHFLVNADIASHIHFLKHRIGVSLNAESARYKELNEDKYYIPEDWSETEQKSLERHCLQCFDRYHHTLTILMTQGISRKRAKESARYYLPYATQLQFDVMFNWRSFHHFLNLRHKSEAQKEIRDIATDMLNLVKQIEGNPFEHTIKAFGHE